LKLKNIIILLVILIILGITYFISKILVSSTPQEPVVYVWSVEDNELTHIDISLPHENKKQSFIKIEQEDKFPWFFNDKNKSDVDTKRWGGGIPLLLSGPGADRILTENASDEQLDKFGFTRPLMLITLSLKSKKSMVIEIGDSTPNGENYYVKSPQSHAVATVDATWFHVLKGLVTDPPYANKIK
jgi:hypothetical protein